MNAVILCDGCLVRAPFEHRCHTPKGEPDALMMRGEMRYGVCACPICLTRRQVEATRRAASQHIAACLCKQCEELRAFTKALSQ